jgi:polyvinyl alcohol dehydrogenase (cytochrome)
MLVQRISASRRVGSTIGLMACALFAASACHEDDDDDTGRFSLSTDAEDWPLYNRDLSGSRANPAEDVLVPSAVPGLGIEWQYVAAGPVNATPVVVGDRIFAGDVTGLFHALASDGTLLWATQLEGNILSSALVTNRFVFIGTQSGNFYALEPADGAIVWMSHPNPHPLASIQGSPILADGRVIVPITTDEAFAAADPAYACCTGRGSVAAFDPETGALLWQHYMISDADAANGAAGAGVWGTPTFDPDTQRLYVGSGQNYVPPATDTSDSLYALDSKTGDTVWKTQVTTGDIWNFRIPPVGANKDGDFGDSPKIYRLADGRRVLGVGQKTGTFWVFEADTGAVIAQRELLPSGVLGGFQTGCAYASGKLVTNGVNWPDLFVDPDNFRPPPTAGAVIGLASDLSGELWRFETPGSPFISGVALAAGVAYAVSAGEGMLYAIDTESGEALAKISLGPTVSGPSVSRGRVFVGTGNMIIQSLPTEPAGTITALGLSGRSAPAAAP